MFNSEETWRRVRGYDMQERTVAVQLCGMRYNNDTSFDLLKKHYKLGKNTQNNNNNNPSYIFYYAF